MKPWILAAISICLIHGDADGSDNGELKFFLATLPAVEDVTLRFQEIRHSELFNEPLTMEGDLKIDSQGVLVKRIDSPLRETIVINLDELTLETPDKTRRIRLSKSPYLNALASGLRGLLGRDAEAISSVFDVCLNVESNHWLMVLRPLEESLSKHLDRIEVSGCPGQVITVTTHAGPGEWQEMIFQAGATACNQ